MTISGSLFYGESSEYIEILFVGMDYSTMTAIYLSAANFKRIATGIEIKTYCLEAAYGLENVEKGLSGTAVLRGSWEQAEFKAECYTRTGDLWMFNSSNVKSQTMCYPPKEAGLRAKFLIGQPAYRYPPQSIILFAIIDFPYLNMACKDFLDPVFPHAPGPEPGAIIVGKDGIHCAILDNEGTKFIQSNPAVGKVTYDSIAMIERYFPKGVVYKRNPKEELGIFFR